MQLNRELVAILEYLERERGLDRQTVLSAIEGGLLSVYRKKLKLDNITELHIDPQTTEVYLVDETGKRLPAPDMPLGRIMAQSARQMIMQKIREAEKSQLYDEFKGKEGTIVTGLVDHYEQGSLVVNLGRIEGVFPVSELTRDERHRRRGSAIRGIIIEVRREIQGPKIEVIRDLPLLESGKEPGLNLAWASQLKAEPDWLGRFGDRLTETVYLSIDLDFFDPAYVPAVGTPEPGGLGWDETAAFLAGLAGRRRLVGFDVVELDGSVHHTPSAYLAARLVHRLLGLCLPAADRY